jgi:hypothetical protein
LEIAKQYRPDTGLSETDSYRKRPLTAAEGGGIPQQAQQVLFPSSSKAAVEFILTQFF